MINLVTAGLFSKAKEPSRNNQDSILSPVNVNGGFLFAVADGVGSYQGSELASKIAIDSLTELYNENYNVDALQAINRIKLNIEDISVTNLDLERSATTLTYCYINETTMNIVHVGDCRLYVKKGSKLEQLTVDHTQHQKLLDDKIYTKAELKTLPGKNTLTSALSKGIDAEVQNIFADIKEYIDSENCITLVIMSDGAHHFWHARPRFSERTMNNPVAFTSSLLNRIERHGAVDDYSLIAVKFKIKK